MELRCLNIILYLKIFFFLFNKQLYSESASFSLLMTDSGEELLGGFEDRGSRSIFVEQIFCFLSEGLGDRRRRLAEVQENQAAFNNVWVRIHLRGNADKHVIVHYSSCYRQTARCQMPKCLLQPVKSRVFDKVCKTCHSSSLNITALFQTQQTEKLAFPDKNAPWEVKYMGHCPSILYMLCGELYLDCVRQVSQLFLMFWHLGRQR